MADNNNIEKMLRAAVERKNQERMAQERASIVQTIGRDIVGALTPVLKAIAERPLPISEIASAIREGVAQGMRGWNKSDPVINIPPIKFPEQKAPIVNVQPPKVEVTVPAIKIPEIKIPDLNNIMGALRITGWDKSLMDHPIPVQLRDSEGKPVFLGGGGSSPIFAPSGGGGTNFPREVMDLTGTDPALRVSGSFSISASNASTQLIDSSLNAVGTASNPLNVALVSGSASSTVAQIGNSDGDFSAANPLPVTFSAAGFQNVAVSDGQQSSVTSHQFNTDFRALDVYIGGSFTTAVDGYASGDNRLKVDGSAVTQPVSVTDIFATTATSNVVTPDNRVKVDGSGVTQPVSGTVAVSGVTNSVAASIVDSSGIGYSGSNPVPVNLVSQSLASSASTIVDSSGVGYSGSNPVPVNLVSQSLASSASTIVDSTGVGYSGSNPVPITVISGSLTSTKAQIGNSDGDFSGSNPLPITIVSGAAASTNAVLTRQTNPSAVAADYVPLSADDLGRQLVRPLQVRDLMKTAYVSVTNGTEATLLAGVAGAFLDCIMIVGSNNSDAAVSVDIRAVTAGNVVHTMRIPANGSVGWAPAVPWPQDATGNNWTIDGPDETGRTLTFSGLFVQEV